MYHLRLLAFVKREITENRGMLVVSPILIASLLVMFALLGTVRVVIHDPVYKITGLEKPLDQYAELPGDLLFDGSSGNLEQETEPTDYRFDTGHKKTKMKIKKKNKNAPKVYDILSKIVLAMSFIIGVVYAQSAFYSDRKDNSIVFWRSLPFSEWENILVKYVVAHWLAPTILFGTMLVTVLAVSVILYIGAHWIGVGSLIEPLNVVGAVLNPLSIVTAYVDLLLGLFVLLPILSWFFACSAIAKKVPMAFALGIPALLIALEAFLTGGHHVANTLRQVIKSVAHIIHSGAVDWSIVIPSFIFAALMIGLTYWFRSYRYEI